jgi:hypothetical protein
LGNDKNKELFFILQYPCLGRETGLQRDKTGVPWYHYSMLQEIKKMGSLNIFHHALSILPG